MEARRAVALVMILAGVLLAPLAVIDPFDDNWDHHWDHHRDHWELDINWD